MEEEKKLYPMKLIAYDETPAETVHLADLGFPDTQIRNGWLATSTISEIMDMYMDRVVGEGIFAYYGRQFPVLVKRLHCTSRTPLLVHPDDETAGQRFDFLGKAKLWYVVSAAPGARLYLGLKRDVSAEEFYMACRHNQVEELLNVVCPKAGDSFFIRPGVVHCAGEGLEIAEVAESSPLDFRIHDWGRQSTLDPFDEELSLEAAFDFIEFKKYDAQSPAAPSHDEGKATRRLTSNPEFVVTEVSLSDPLHIYCEKFGSFVSYLCLAGEASVQVPAEGANGEKGMENYIITAEESILIPAEIPDYYLVPRKSGTLLLEVLLEPREDADTYIDPAAEDIPEGEMEPDGDDWNDYGINGSGKSLLN